MATCEVTEVNSGVTFTIDTNEIVLDGALARGIKLPHQCRGASCGTCKAKVLEGAVDHGWSFGFAINEAEKEQGLCLLCQARPLSATLRVETLQIASEGVPEVSELDAEVLSNVALTPRVRRLVLALRRPVSTVLPAGCYVEVCLPGISPHRMYSLAAPFAGDIGLVELFVARHPQGRASGFIHDDLDPGAALTIRGPFGTCRLPAGNGPVLGLAGGTGLAPVLAIFEAQLRSGCPDEFVLVLSVRESREVFALDRLEHLARRYQNFGYRILVTDEPSRYSTQPVLAPDWIRAHYPSLRGHRGVISGAPGFVEACAKTCQELGMNSADIATDSFTPVSAELALICPEPAG
ncbi:2Fe-2S iron-sulfur cluster binding domain-containing protein [Paraburkholderia agricolaris]|uniref:2Fe-2S iron-sulfur cluster binding domain-containing protein n=1 Tax=Paraburkholderia agricolaris TaxID=2152888 RepID=A0ABW8ZX05_9BURK